jgi:hypothetical protein
VQAIAILELFASKFMPPKGIILSGVGEWELARCEPRPHVYCFEHDLDDNRALQFILQFSGPRKGLNDFIRIRLALRLEEYLHNKGRENMSAAGRNKGLTNSPNLAPINVRQMIADSAATGTGNIDKVRTILRKAHPNIIRALQDGSLRIHRAWAWCKLSQIDQLNVFQEYEEALAMRRTARKINKRRIDPFSTHQILQSLNALRSHARERFTFGTRSGEKPS